MVASIKERAGARRRTLTPAQRHIGAQTRHGDDIAGKSAQAEHRRAANRG